MKALSLTQPWAQAMFLNLKRFETRSWRTNYRGPLLIHAAKGFPTYAKEFATAERALGRGEVRLPLGALIGKLELIKIWRTEELMGTLPGIESLYGDYSPGRYAWETSSPILFDTPIPYRGSLGLFDVPDEIIREALNAIRDEKG